MKLEMSLTPDVGFIKTDRLSFEQAILNLVINARETTPSRRLDHRAHRARGARRRRAPSRRLRDGRPRARDHRRHRTRDGGPTKCRASSIRSSARRRPGAAPGSASPPPHTFARNCRGHVEVSKASSDAGRRSSSISRSRPRSRAVGRRSSCDRSPAMQTILVVDDEPARRALHAEDPRAKRLPRARRPRRPRKRSPSCASAPTSPSPCSTCSCPA